MFYSIHILRYDLNYAHKHFNSLYMYMVYINMF